MTPRWIATGFILLLSPIGSQAGAQPARIEGTVQGPDEVPIRGAYVLIEQSRFTAVTDAQGRFVLDGPEIGFEGTLSVTSPEYQQEKRKITVTEPVMTLTVTLRPSVKPEPVVAAEVPLLITDATNRITLSTEQALSLPSHEQKDVVRALQWLPRVTHDEVPAGLLTRGGSADQTLTRFDGITLYDLDRLFGYMSALEMEAVDRVQLATGPFDARTAGRLSGAAEITGKSGNARRGGGGGSISLLDVSGIAEVPFGGRGSALVATRRSYPSPLSKWILTLVDGEGGSKPDPDLQSPLIAAGSAVSEPTSTYFDLHGKVLFQPSANDRAFLSLYRGREDLDLSRDELVPVEITDRFAAIRLAAPDGFTISEPRHTLQTGLGAEWSRVWSNRIQTQIGAARTTFEATHKRDTLAGTIQNILEEASTIEERAGRGTLTITAPGGNSIDLGAELSDHDVQYRFRNAWLDASPATDGLAADPFRDRSLRDPNAALSRSERGRLAGLYAQHRLDVQNRVSVMPGFRATRFDRTRKWYTEPHISGRVHLGANVSLNAAWGRAYQFVMQVEREDLLRGSRRFWTLADATRIPVTSSIERSGGASFASARVLVDVQAFDKEIDGLVILAPGLTTQASILDGNRFLRQGSGTARGVEGLVQTKLGPNTAAVSYTGARVRQNFPAISRSEFPADHDRRHQVKVVDSLRIGPLTLAGIWTYSTGRPFTPLSQRLTITFPETPEGEEVAPPPIVGETLQIGARNSRRLPNQHRLDLSLTRGFRVGSGRAVIGGSVLNLYNQTNIWYKEFTAVSRELVETDIVMMTRSFNAFFSLKF